MKLMHTFKPKPCWSVAGVFDEEDRTRGGGEGRGGNGGVNDANNGGKIRSARK